MCGLAAANRSWHAHKHNLLRASLPPKRFWRPACLQESLSELLLDPDCHLLCTCCSISIVRQNECRSSLLETPEQVLPWVDQTRSRGEGPSA